MEQLKIISIASRYLLAIALATLIVLSTLSGHAQNIYVTKSGSPAPTGEQSTPYHMIESGIVKAGNTAGSTILIEPGNYYETFTVNTPCILKTTQGKVTIGKLDYKASTTLEIITLNTHLFGDVVLTPSWKDYERADDIADLISKLESQPDVVGFQEIWDEDLFFGGDGANGILPRSGYPHGDHGQETKGTTGNSGLAIMSKYSLAGFKQVKFDDCDGEDCLSAKGWIQSTINKDGFSIGLFNLHTQADEGHWWVRLSQIDQLVSAVIGYRKTHPNNVVFVMGDFNIYGENLHFAEYNDLIKSVGEGASGKDADRNAPGFIFGYIDMCTLSNPMSCTFCDCNPLSVYFDKDAISGRLDYIFYSSSLDGSVEVLPASVNVLPFRGRTLTEDDLTTNESSDHWAVHGKFKIIQK